MVASTRNTHWIDSCAQVKIGKHIWLYYKPSRHFYSSFFRRTEKKEKKIFVSLKSYFRQQFLRYKRETFANEHISCKARGKESERTNEREGVQKVVKKKSTYLKKTNLLFIISSDLSFQKRHALLREYKNRMETKRKN